MTYTVIGIDVGGTRTKGVALSADGAILAEETRPTTRDNASLHLGPDVGALVEALRAQVVDPVRHVGVAVPGLVDEGRGIGVWSANLGWRDLDLAATLDPHLAAPSTFGHDVRTGLLGEQRLGAARGHDNVCFIPLGTGLASALLVGGRVVRGNPWSGELGHITVDPDGDRCGCGRRGCLETLVGGAGLARRWHARGGTGDAEALVRCAAGGDEVAAQLWAAGVDALAAALAPALATTGIDLVVVGGGLSRAGEALLRPLTDGLHRRMGDAPVSVVPAELGDRAGALGAAVLALDALESS